MAWTSEESSDVLRELEVKGQVSPSWTGSDFDHYSNVSHPKT